MCLVLYVGTTNDIPLVPWDEKKPAFNVAILSSDYEKQALRHFGEMKVHYLGSDKGCGCGFRQVEDVQFAELQEAAKERQANHDALVEYLKKLPPQKIPVKIYACWSGDEELPISSCRTIALDEITKPEFFFREREMIDLTSNMAY
jgi:hypothetical protein